MAKFSVVDLFSAFNAPADDLSAWPEEYAAAVPALPGGRQTFWGIPFQLGEADCGPANRLLVVGAHGSREAVTIPLQATATHVVIAHFCDSRTSQQRPPDAPYPLERYSRPEVTAIGERLATYVLVYDDGSEASVPIRRRFEVDQLLTRPQSLFAARHHPSVIPLDHRGPYPRDGWGRMQTGVFVGPFQGVGAPVLAPYWSIYALPNPRPDQRLAAVRVEPTGAAAVGIGGITLFSGQQHPLRHNQLESVLVEGTADDAQVSVDLGIVARHRRIRRFEPGAWLAAPETGWGEDPADAGATSFIVDLSASPDATLTVGDSRADLASLYRSGRAESADGTLRLTLLTPSRTWLHAKVIDSATGRPTPCRIHFRSGDGRYFPPYGHRHEVNDNWFEDYGADLKLGGTEYAYVDGSFQVELPVGEVYVEVSKGFEYAPVRQKLQIGPGQRELELRLERVVDLRKEGWVTADTHTHFLSPDTAWLEARAEGVNLVNLLASQWGDLFTNVGDLTGQLAGASRDDTIVWVGTENRQHFLGHISLLGTQGNTVFPLCTGGPTEGYIGDPLLRAMSEWADECRAKGGVVVVPHFPSPYSEVVAEVVRGRVDGVEIRYFSTPSLDTWEIHEWYRLLNCGYRVAAVGGTDKMSAGMPVGGVRTYAFIGRDAEFTFESWGEAVRAGRTYTTSGPLLSLSVEGKRPGDVLKLPGRGGRLRVEASAIGTNPFHTLQIVFNGHVVAEETSAQDARSLTLTADVEVSQAGWIAARCVSKHRAWHVWPVHFGAHTSPVYVEVNGSEVFDGPTAEYLITIMEGGVTWLDTLAIPASPERHRAIRAVFEAGIAELRRRMPR